MGGAEKLRAEKKVNTGCSLMLHINRAFSGGGVKVSAATVHQASEETGLCRAAMGRVVISGPLRTLVCVFGCVQGTQN